MNIFNKNKFNSTQRLLTGSMESPPQSDADKDVQVKKSLTTAGPSTACHDWTAQ